MTQPRRISKQDITDMRKERMTYREIGEYYGVSRQRIHQIFAPTTQQPKFMDSIRSQWRPIRCSNPKCRKVVEFPLKASRKRRHCSINCRKANGYNS